MFVEKVDEYLLNKIKQYPCHTNRASEIGHTCLRYLTYCRLNWRDRSLPDLGLERIFSMGHDIEEQVVRDLKAAGVQVHGQQRPFEWREYQLSGTIDGSIIHDGKEYPFDVKSSSPYVFKTINSLNDLTNSKYVYLRKYPYQLNAYLLMGNVDKGLFIFKDKVSGQLKEIWMQLDYELGEETIRKCEAVNRFVANNDLPDRIAFDDRLCGNCGFAHICLPDMIGKEIEIDAGELELLIKRMEELRISASEFDELNDEINRLVTGKEKIMAGDYFVTGKWIERKGGAKYWKKSIVKI